MVRQWCATHDRIHDDQHLTPEKVQHDYVINKKIQIGRCDHMPERDNDLDEEFKTVSAQQAETFEVL